MTTRIAVTGATGFVGRSLCRALTRRGAMVRAIVRHPQPGLPAAEQVVVPDAGPNTDWRPSLEGMTDVVHLAGVAHRVADRGAVPAAEYDRVNVGGTESLAKDARLIGSVRRVVLVSSIGAVATESERPLGEDAPCRPTTPYGASKLCAEEVLRRALEGTSVEWCIVRPPLVYGPGNPGNMGRLLRLLDVGIPLPFKAIRNRRSLIYIGNLVDALTCCLERPAAAGRVFHVSDGQDLSTPELVRLLGEVSGRAVRLWPVPTWLLLGVGGLGELAGSLLRRRVGLDRGTIKSLVGSCIVDGRAIREVLDWTPPIAVRDGLAATVSRDRSPQ